MLNPYFSYYSTNFTSLHVCFGFPFRFVFLFFVSGYCLQCKLNYTDMFYTFLCLFIYSNAAIKKLAGIHLPEHFGF